MKNIDNGFFLTIKKVSIAIAISLFSSLNYTSNASAIGIIAIDLDPVTPGIQQIRTVSKRGYDSLSIAVVIFEDDVNSQFTNFNLEALFNNRMSSDILGSVSNVRLGNIVTGTSALDINNLADDIGLNSTLETSRTLAPENGFESGTGAVNVVNHGREFSLVTGVPETLFNFDVSIESTGITDIQPTAGFALGGTPILTGATHPLTTFGSFQDATLHVVPEPSTIVGAGLTLILGSLIRLRHRRYLQR